jgi:signal transduction histidine kinase
MTGTVASATALRRLSSSLRPAWPTTAPGRKSERERRRLARDLHDNVVQQILAAGLAIDWCLSEVPAGSPVHGRLAHAKRLTTDAMRELRSALRALSAPRGSVQSDLPELLRRVVEVHGAGRLGLNLRVTGMPITLPAAVTESLRSIAGECLFNSAVHGGALHADVSLSYKGDNVTLTIADDGRGDAETLSAIMRGEVPGTDLGYHTGLTDMAARAAEFGGTLRAVPSHLGGIAVTTTLSVNRVTSESGDADG